eukprot:2080046-Pyramimonas_sp.AAC.1
MHHQPNQAEKTRVVYHMVGEVGLPSKTGLEERERHEGRSGRGGGPAAVGRDLRDFGFRRVHPLGGARSIGIQQL